MHVGFVPRFCTDMLSCPNSTVCTFFGWGREYFIITHSCYCDQSAESLMWCGGGQRLLPPRATFKNLAVCGTIQWLYFNILWWVRLLHHRCVFFVFMLKILGPQFVAEASQGLSNIKQMAVTVFPCTLIVKKWRIVFFFVLIQCNKTQHFNSLVYPPSRRLAKEVATRRISTNTQGKGGMKRPSLSLSLPLSLFLLVSLNSDVSWRGAVFCHQSGSGEDISGTSILEQRTSFDCDRNLVTRRFHR